MRDVQVPPSPPTLPGQVGFGSCSVPGRHAVYLGAAAGWLACDGVLAWSHEATVCLRSDLTGPVLAKIEGVLPEDQIDAGEHPLAARAAAGAAVLAVTPGVFERLAAEGVRLHTVGFDRVSGGFYYLAKGGAAPEQKVQGDLFAAVRHALAGSEAADDLERCLDGLVDRLLSQLSSGALSERAVELAATLPPVRTKLEPRVDAAELEQKLRAQAQVSAAVAVDGKAAAAALSTAAERGQTTVRIAPWGRFERVSQPTLAVELNEGDEGKGRFFVLPERARWLLAFEVGPSAADAEKAAAEKAAAEKAAAEKAAAEKAAAEKAAAQKAAAEKAAAEKAAAEKAAAEKAAAQKAAAEKAAAEKAAAEKAAAQKAAAEKAAAEKAAAEKAAAEKAAAEKAAAEKAAAEKAAAEKAAAQKAAAEKAAAEKAAAEKAAAEKAAAEKAAAEKAAAEKAAAQKAATEKAAAEKAAAEKAAAEKAAAEKAAAQKAATPAKAAASPQPSGKSQKAKKAAKKAAKRAEKRAAAQTASSNKVAKRPAAAPEPAAQDAREEIEEESEERVSEEPAQPATAAQTASRKGVPTYAWVVIAVLVVAAAIAAAHYLPK